jgi:hypothetical protein
MGSSLGDLTITIYVEPTWLNRIELLHRHVNALGSLHILRATFANLHPYKAEPYEDENEVQRVSRRLLELLPSIKAVAPSIKIITNLHFAPVVDLLHRRIHDGFLVHSDSEDYSLSTSQPRALSDECLCALLQAGWAKRLIGFGMYWDLHSKGSVLTMLTELTTLSLHAGDVWGDGSQFSEVQKSLARAFEAFKMLTHLTLVDIWTEYYPRSLESLSLQRGPAAATEEEWAGEPESLEAWEAFLVLGRLQSLVLHPAWWGPQCHGKPRIACARLQSVIINPESDFINSEILNQLFFECPDIQRIEVQGDCTRSLLINTSSPLHFPRNLVHLFIEIPEVGPYEVDCTDEGYTPVSFGDFVKPLHTRLYPKLSHLVIYHHNISRKTRVIYFEQLRPNIIALAAMCPSLTTIDIRFNSARVEVRCLEKELPGGMKSLRVNKRWWRINMTSVRESIDSVRSEISSTPTLVLGSN